MIRDYYGAIKYIRTILGSLGFGLVFEEKCQPRTNGKEVYCQEPNPDWKQEEWDDWMAILLHEIGHNVQQMRDIFDVMQEEQLTTESVQGSLLNLLDDYRQEKYELGKLPGRDILLSKGHGRGIKKLSSSIMDEKFADNPSYNKMWQAIRTVYTWETAQREAWQPHVAASEVFMNALTTDERGYLDKLCKGNYAHRLNDPDLTAVNEFKIVTDILKDVFDWTDEDFEKDKEQQTQQGKGNGEGGESSDGESGGEYGEDDGEKGEQSGGKVKYSDLLKHKHDEKDSGTYSTAPLEIEYDDWDDTTQFPCKEVKEVSIKTSTGGHYLPQVARLAASNLSSRVKRLLKVMAMDRVEHGVKKGKIDKKTLYRAAITDDSEYSKRVFKKKIENNILNTAIYVLLDGSGSMGGEKIINGIKALGMLSDVMVKLRIPTSCSIFTDTDRTIIYKIKDFDESLSEQEVIGRACVAVDNGMENNADGEALLYAYNKLIRRKEKRKLLLVLSDGQPDSGRSGVADFTKKVIGNIEKDPRVEIYGLGIMYDVSLFYKHNTVINSPQELEEALLKVISNYIIN